MIGTALNRAEMRKLIDHMSDMDQPWVRYMHVQYMCMHVQYMCMHVQYMYVCSCRTVLTVDPPYVTWWTWIASRPRQTLALGHT